MYETLDGPATQGVVSVGTAAAVEVKVGAQPLESRKVVVIQPSDGRVYLYWADNQPTVTDMQNAGILLYKRGTYSFEAADSQPLWLLAVNGTVNVKIVERA